MNHLNSIFKNSPVNDLSYLLSKARQGDNSHFTGLDITQYFSMLKFSADRHVFEQDNFIQLALMVYGWMPTMNKSSDLSRIETAVEIINAQRGHSSSRLDQNSLEILRLSVNSSYVGLSKFLHVLNPAYYPIWDSRIARAIGCPSYDISRNAEKYMSYTTWLHQIIANSDISAVREFSQTHHGNSAISDVRALEYCLYIAGERPR